MWFSDSRFLQIEGVGQPGLKYVYKHHFSSRICSPCVSVSCFGNSLNIFNFYYYYYICYGDLWSVIFDVTIAKISWLTEGLDDCLRLSNYFLAIQSFELIYVLFFRHSENYNILHYNVNIVFICTGKPKKVCVTSFVVLFALLL